MSEREKSGGEVCVCLRRRRTVRHRKLLAALARHDLRRDIARLDRRLRQQVRVALRLINDGAVERAAGGHIVRFRVGVVLGAPLEIFGVHGPAVAHPRVDRLHQV